NFLVVSWPAHFASLGSTPVDRLVSGSSQLGVWLVGRPHSLRINLGGHLRDVGPFLGPALHPVRPAEQRGRWSGGALVAVTGLGRCRGPCRRHLCESHFAGDSCATQDRWIGYEPFRFSRVAAPSLGQCRNRNDLRPSVSQ